MRGQSFPSPGIFVRVTSGKSRTSKIQTLPPPDFKKVRLTGVAASLENNSRKHPPFFRNDDTALVHQAGRRLRRNPQDFLREFSGMTQKKSAHGENRWTPETDRKSTRLNSSHIPLSR